MRRTLIITIDLQQNKYMLLLSVSLNCKQEKVVDLQWTSDICDRRKIFLCGEGGLHSDMTSVNFSKVFVRRRKLLFPVKDRVGVGISILRDIINCFHPQWKHTMIWVQIIITKSTTLQCRMWNLASLRYTNAHTNIRSQTVTFSDLYKKRQPLFLDYCTCPFSTQPYAIW